MLAIQNDDAIQHHSLLHVGKQDLKMDMDLSITGMENGQV